MDFFAKGIFIGAPATKALLPPPPLRTTEFKHYLAMIVIVSPSLKARADTSPLSTTI